METRKMMEMCTSFVLIAMILQIVGVATPSWMSGEIRQGVSSRAGLWRICAEAYDVEECVDWPTVPEWLDATRALGVLALLLMAASSGLSVFVLIKPDNRLTVTLATICCGLGAACSVTSFGVFVGKEDEQFPTEVYSYDYSFGLCVAAAAMGCIGSVLFLALFRRVH
ncbi:uncharacterized protein LOC143291042 [Babylonia areolata]|uniref:uncharacterized protein LOC143291042 n=1 Tax=Babylonia areolata TaxID=304850 RepID=UPI003FD2EDCF